MTQFRIITTGRIPVNFHGPTGGFLMAVSHFLIPADVTDAKIAEGFVKWLGKNIDILEEFGSDDARDRALAGYLTEQGYDSVKMCDTWFNYHIHAKPLYRKIKDLAELERLKKLYPEQ